MRNLFITVFVCFFGLTSVSVVSAADTGQTAAPAAEEFSYFKLLELYYTAPACSEDLVCQIEEDIADTVDDVAMSSKFELPQLIATLEQVETQVRLIEATTKELRLLEAEAKAIQVEVEKLEAELRELEHQEE